MSKKAFGKIADGLREALAVVRGEIPVEAIREGNGGIVLRPIEQPRRCLNRD